MTPLQQLSHVVSTAGSWQGVRGSQGAVLVGAGHGDVWLCGQGRSSQEAEAEDCTGQLVQEADCLGCSPDAASRGPG
jgi:hypothetical protein